MSHGIKGETSAQGTPKGTTIGGIVGVVFGTLKLFLGFFLVPFRLMTLPTFSSAAVPAVLSAFNIQHRL